MALNITNLFYSEKDIGAKIKMSKRQFIWEFDLNGSNQRIELLDSRLTHKKRLYKNGINILNTSEEGNFIHNFQIDGHPCVVIQYGDKIELRIDNQSFTHLYNLQKNKQLFAGDKGPTSNVYIAKPYNNFGSSGTEDYQNSQNGGTSYLYKVNKPEEENKPKLFNFEIKKESGNKTHGFNSKFKFGQNKDTSKNSIVNNQNNNNSNTNNNNNKENMDLLGFQNQTTNENNNNNINNNNNLLDFGENNNSNVNNQNQNQNIQNPPKTGNDIFDLFGSSNNQNNNNSQNNNNQFNNIFLQISDGTNQKPNFDQNNLGFLDLMNNNANNNLNNGNMNNIMNSNVNNNMNNNNNFGNQQINQNINNNSSQNQQNNNQNIVDLLKF